MEDPRPRIVAAWREALARFPGFDPLAEVLLERRGELGRGGMGVVWRVRDARLDREAALKVCLPASGAARERALRRFAREIAITARLEHPQVPPVYAAGTTSGGEPWLLMKLVRGEPLSKRLEEHDWDGPVDDDERRFLHEQLEVLVRVGEAVAFAHEQRIVHRDLKPANVFVGRFGETLVMDWGLAKDLSRGEDEDARLRADLTGSGPSAAAPGVTQAGAILGTLGYAAPEQVAGEPVDERADVFGLGAVLVEVLTGKLPFDGETGFDLAQATDEGRVVLPRDRRPGLARELDSIAAHALARDRAARTPTARAFVADLRAYLAGEPVSVHSYGPGERALRLVRRHPTALVIACALAVLAGAGLGLAAWARGAAERASVAARAGQAALARKEAEEALAVLARAKETDRLAPSLRALGAAQRWREAARDEASTAAVQSAARALGDVALGSAQWDLAREAFALAGEDARARVQDAREAEARRRRAEVEKRLQALRDGTDDDVDEASSALARWPEPATVEVLASALDAVSAKLEGAAAARTPGTVLAPGGRTLALAVARALGRIAIAERALPSLRRYLAAETDQLRAAEAALAIARFGTEEALATVDDARYRFGVNGAFSTQVMRGLSRLGKTADVASAEPDSVHGWLERGELRLGRGDHKGAIEDFDRVLARDPRSWKALTNRGIARYELGDLRGDVEDQTRAIELSPRHAALYVNRANARRRLGDSKGSREDCDRALELDPRDASALHNRALARLDLGDPKGALEDCNAAIELDPRNAHAFRDKGVALYRLGDRKGADEHWTRAIELDPRDPIPFANRGGLRVSLGDPRGAVEDCTRAIELDPRYATAYTNRASARYDLGDMKGAVEDATSALAIEPRDATTLANRARARQALGDAKGALEDFDRALELDPRRRSSLANRARVREKLGDVAGAIDDYTRAIALDPKMWEPYASRAKLRLERGELGPALEDCDRVVELSPERGAARTNRALVRRKLGDLAGAIADWEEALRLEPQASWAEATRGKIAEARKALEAK